MGFKLNGVPYNEDNMNIGVYKRDLKDGSAGKSNHTGIIVDKDISKEMEDAVVAHETVHQHQQRNGELDYDENNFYWKGKTYPRENLNEHNENLPWEKEAYKASNGVLNGKKEDMKKRFQLEGYRGNNKPFKGLTDRKLIGSQDDGASVVDPTKKKTGKTAGNLKYDVRYDLYKEGVGGKRNLSQREFNTMGKDKEFMKFVAGRKSQEADKARYQTRNSNRAKGETIVSDRTTIQGEKREYKGNTNYVDNPKQPGTKMFQNMKGYAKAKRDQLGY